MCIRDRVHREHAALALDQLQQHGAHVLPGLGLHVGQIVGAGVAEALREGEEVLVEHVLAGGGKGGEGAAVKGVAQGQDCLLYTSLYANRNSMSRCFCKFNSILLRH